MNDTYPETTVRNRGIILEEQQEILKNAVITVAGCGAGGGATAVSLARLGVRNFRLADLDTIDYTNINRQEGAYHSTVGQNKVEVIKRLILDIHPEATVELYPEGLNESNVEKFLQGSDLVLEEIDYRKPQYTLLVHQQARALNIPLFTTIPVAWNAFLFYFDPKGMTYEEYTGINPEKLLTSSDLRTTAFIPEPPLYLSQQLLQDVLDEKIDIPAVDTGVRLASALASAYCAFYLTGSKKLKPVPHYYSTGDLFEKEAKMVDPESASALDLLFSTKNI